MKENIATIPLMDAFHAEDECPFCNLERKAEQHAISFILGLIGVIKNGVATVLFFPN